MSKTICVFLCSILLLACSSEKKDVLKVAATPIPQAEMLEFIKPELESQGINIVIVVTDDYNMPNRALANKEIDANFFQHLPFLEEQIKHFHYPLESIAKIEIEPMGIYSKKLHSLADLPEKGTVAIPNDPSNEARALLLLQHAGVIQLENPNNLQSTVLNIRHNPKQIKFIEADAAMLPRTLDDVDAAVINTNFALQAHLSPVKDALVLEDKNSPYANILVIRKGEENRPDIQALKQAMISQNMKEFIREKYHGAVLPAF